MSICLLNPQTIKAELINACHSKPHAGALPRSFSFAGGILRLRLFSTSMQDPEDKCWPCSQLASSRKVEESAVLMGTFCCFKDTLRWTHFFLWRCQPAKYLCSESCLESHMSICGLPGLRKAGGDCLNFFVQETKVCVFVIHIHVVEMRSVVWLRSVVESILPSTSPPVVLNLRSAVAF